MIQLRPYQNELKQKIYDSWNAGFRNVLAVMPTGMGKTKLFALIAKEMAILPKMGHFPTAILVHRKELVQQISLTLAEENITHNIIAPRGVIRGIQAAHRRLLGKQFYHDQGQITVISVDTLVSKNGYQLYSQWAKQIKLWITDEATHVLEENKWGRAIKFFENAIGLGVTATPRRLDKKGLGRHADGVFDVMVMGPTSRWGIENGFLCKYKIAVPPSDYGKHLGAASGNSDFSKKRMIDAARKSKIVGDVVKNYKKFADGKQAILFADSIETAEKMEKKFNDAGISAKLLTGDTPDQERLNALIDFTAKKIRVLINVDLFDEGLDVPGIECVILARPTMSVGKYLQMIGRGLRPAEGKDFLIIIDHVGNVLSDSGGPNHGLPDNFREWTLDRITKRHDKTNLLRVCDNTECNSPYDRVLTECPWCGAEAIKRGGGGGGGGKPTAKEVDGDLFLLDPDTIRAMEKGSQLENPADVAARVSAAAGNDAGVHAMRKQMQRIETQKKLADRIARWAGEQRHYRYYNDRQIHKYFYMLHDMTITYALSQKTAEMEDTINSIHLRDEP